MTEQQYLDLPESVLKAFYANVDMYNLSLWLMPIDKAKLIVDNCMREAIADFLSTKNRGTNHAFS